jgi:tetratricopeptide (TPR) repeat protein
MNAQLQEGSKSYMSLFREIDRMDSYDEPTLKSRLQSLKYKIENLAVSKVQLTKLILKSLRSFHEANSPNQQVMGLMTEAEILKGKGLYAQAMKLLEKAKAAAIRHEMHYYVFEILNRQVFMGFHSIEKDNVGKLDTLFEEIERLKHNFQKETELIVLANSLTLLMQTKSLKHPSTIAIIEDLAKNEVLKHINDSDPFFVKLYFFFAHAQMKHALGDYVSANPHYLKILQLWERNHHLRKLHNRLYKLHIANYLNSCHTLGKYESFDHWLEKFQSVEDTNFDEEAGSFKDFYHIKLLYLLNTGQFRAALDLAKDVESGLEKYKFRISKSRETTLRFNVFITYFINEKYAEALDWLGTMALDNKIDARADTRALARIMRVIVHYELGHSRILDSLRTSVYRKLKKDEQLHEFERTILDHIRQLEAIVGKKALQAHWEALFQKLNDLGDRFGWNKIAGLEEITCWAESKVLQRSYVDLMEAKKKH